VIPGSYEPEILGVSEFLAVKLPLKPWDPVMTKLLGSWAPGLLGSWAPGLLGSWAPGLLGSWAPGIPGSWACYNAWKWFLLWASWGCLLCLKAKYTSTKPKGPEPLVWRVFWVPAPAGSGRLWLFWNRCWIPLTSDPKILGLLGHLQSGESSGDQGTVCWVRAQVVSGLALTGSALYCFLLCNHAVLYSSALSP
jgi:hypothetical protein